MTSKVGYRALCWSGDQVGEAVDKFRKIVNSCVTIAHCECARKYYWRLKPRMNSGAARFGLGLIGNNLADKIKELKR